MAKVAILGFGVVGSGVAEVITQNGASIAEKTAQALELKYILDVRDFPDSPFADKLIKDFSIIEQDPEIDVVATPAGRPTALVHTNTCTSDVDAWVRLFGEFYELMGQQADLGELFPKLFRKALEGEPDCGGLVSFNYFSGEPVTGTETGRPMFARLPGGDFTLANFMRAQLYGAIAALKLGIDLLVEQEGVKTDRLLGHGGFFKTEGVGRQIMADALGVPISTMTTAGEGGPWGMALLAAYLCRRAEGETVEDYLEKVFSRADSQTSHPDPAGNAGFQAYIRRYTTCLPAERALAAME